MSRVGTHRFVWLQRVSHAAGQAAGLVLAALAATVLLQVGSRYLFSAPLTWTIDGATILLIWLSFLGAATAAFEREHFAVGLAVDMLPLRLRLVVGVFSNVATALMVVVLAVVGLRFALIQMGQVYPSVNIAKGWAAIAIPVSALLMLPRYLLDALDAALDLTTAGATHPPPDATE